MTYYFACAPVLKPQFCTTTDYYTHVGEVEGAYSQVYLLLFSSECSIPTAEVRILLQKVFYHP